jgi:hypothetical protein
MTACTLDGANLIGPAGGYVFYDKGGYSGGWRYLEAAPDDAGGGDWDRAVQICENYSLGGYNDWRLPDVDELDKLLDSGGGKGKVNNIEREALFWSSKGDQADSSQAWGIEIIKEKSTNDKGEPTATYKIQPPATYSKMKAGAAWPVRGF